MIAKTIYLTGILARNRSIFECYRSLLATDRSERRVLKTLQAERLSRIVAHAYAESPYYRRRFDEAQVQPRDIRSAADLELLPVTRKSDLLTYNPEIQNTIDGEKMFYSETSGSSGSPLVFYRNQRWDAWHNASVFRGYHWHGVKPWERNGYLWGYNIDPKASRKVALFDRLQNRFRLFSYSDKQLANFADKLQTASHLGGYSSMIYELAKFVNRQTCSSYQFNLKLVKGTSEKIFESYQDAVLEAFGRRIVSEYGAAEAGIIGFECPDGNMHVNMETVVVEVVDEEILVTNLFSDSFPIIRYALGDYVDIDETSVCPCGRSSPIIRSITGRVGAVIQGKESTYPSLVLYYVFKNLAANHGIELNYQGVQDERGILTLKLERSLTDQERDLLDGEIEKYFSTDLEVNVREAQKWVTGNAKTKDFVSNL